MVLARHDVGTITLEQWKRREQPAPPVLKYADRLPMRDPPERRTWTHLLERRARQCRGCGAWMFDGPYCDWCTPWAPQPPVIPNAVPKKRTAKVTANPQPKRQQYTPLRVLGEAMTYPCCEAKRDSLGRKPIGWCGPQCERRAARVKEGADR